MTLFIMISIAAAIFIGGSMLMELIKIRKALEYTAYRKEVHEVIETSYHDNDEEIDDQNDEHHDCSKDHCEHHHHHHHEHHGDSEVKKKRVQKIYRKTKIKVISEDE